MRPPIATESKLFLLEDWLLRLPADQHTLDTLKVMHDVVNELDRKHVRFVSFPCCPCRASSCLCARQTVDSPI